MKKKVVVTGAAGMLGQDVVNAFYVAGFDVDAYDHQWLNITSVRDVEESQAIALADVVVNCAAYTDVDGAEDDEEIALDVNCAGVQNLAEAVGRSGGFFIHISTDFVFDGKKKSPYTEDDALGPINAYGRTKMLGEVSLEHTTPCRWTILRTSWLYGRHGSNFVSKVVEFARKNPDSQVFVVEDELGTPTYTRDLASAIVRVADEGIEGLYHCANSVPVSRVELARDALRRAGLRNPVQPATDEEIRLLFQLKALRPKMTALDCGKLRGMGIEMRSWSEALGDYFSDV